MRKALTLGIAFLLSAAGALSYVPGSEVFYSVSSDPITDINTSFVVVGEVNDIEFSTNLYLECSNGKEAEVWAVLETKNPLFDPEEEIMPDVTVRIGSGKPQKISGANISAADGIDGDLNNTQIGFEEGISREMAAGLYRGDKVAIRVYRDPYVGRQTLTYVFPGKGFAEAWNGVNRCQPLKKPAKGKN